ncbi:MAG: DUF4112 domain-containing protein [Deltaproteobacteria bacterium]|nr:DUF4112 domain-containing protein [Deltaproteobacteria bacterium]MBW1904007.1 DUF4112 domain-containing protein [Deltaproteobacteria bacterium]MBW2158652.1 DUF4112 domain-containing protein [Deltaproteobacteria bacterium]MBW2375331.1 DUF4112 domain-containing protein [Deltaproteobacteria bacterium]MBW2585812.1 DUF4112 domain-containing protein [Deltaproteobacteria bacterium]
MVDPDRSVSKLRQWAEHLVTLLDDRFRIPGTDFRFGLDPIIGILFPGVGDVVTGAGSVGLMALALRRGVPRVVLFRMILNILVDVVAGSLPIVGDIFDAAYKSNRRNLELIREHETPGSKATAMDYAIAMLGIVLAVLSIIVPLAAALYFGLNYGPELLEHLQRR